MIIMFDDDREYFTVHELFGTSKNVYPLVYALKIYNYSDFYFTVVREAYYVGVSVLDNEITNEVVFLEEDDSEIIIDEEGDFPYNSLPATGVFLDYDSAKAASNKFNELLIEDYKKRHFSYEVDSAKEAINKADKLEELYVSKDINRNKKDTHMFSTVYVKTKHPN